MMQQSSSPVSGTATPRTSGTPRGAPDLWAGLWHVLPAAACCLSWTFISSSAIFVNKSILVDLKFPYPVTVAWLGLLTTTLTSAAVVGHVVPEAQRVYLSRRAFMTRAMPTGFCMALTFQCGNLSYLYLTVSFIQMLKAFCPVITMLLLFVARLERPTPQLVLAVTIISAGVAVASYGEMHMSVFGLTAMLTSVVAESARLVLTQHLVCASHQLHPLEGLMYIGGACTFWLTIQAGFWELGPILRTHALHKVVLHPLHFLVAALAGLGVNALAILTIKLTSSLTLKVLGTVKDAVLVTVGVVFMHEQVSNLQLYGYCCSVLGFCLYNWIKATVQPEKKTRPSLLPVRETMKAA